MSAGPAASAAAPAVSPLPGAPATAREGSVWWIWVLAGLGALGALTFAGWRWRDRQARSRFPAVPQVQRPRVPETANPQPAAGAETPTPMPPAAQASAPAPAREPLQISLEPLRLSLTLLNATLAYRLEVINRGPATVEALQIGADMISAHASMSREEQLSGPARSAATIQRIERLEPGESRIVQGEFRLPFPQIVPIRQGNAALLMPLARFRLETPGAAPVVRTFVVGQPGAGTGLQPFRLDLGPRVYPRLAQRAFA